MIALPGCDDVSSKLVLTGDLQEVTEQAVFLSSRVYEDGEKGEDGEEVLLQQLEQVLHLRWRLLKDAAAHEPAQVIENALPASILDNLPVQFLGLVERRIEDIGKVHQIISDGRNGFVDAFAASDAEWHFLSGDKRYQLSFDSRGTSVVPGLQSQMHATVSGIAVGNLLFPTYVDTSKQPEYRPAVVGEQRVAVFLVNFRDPVAEPWTKQRVEQVMFGPGSSVSEYFREVSAGTTWLAGDVFGWWTMDLAQADCSKINLSHYATKVAIENGVSLTDYGRIIIASPTPNAPDCQGVGTGELGTWPSTSWVWDFSKSVVTHELGHNHGLGHSMGLTRCTQSVPTEAACDKIAYGHPADVMGDVNAFGHFAPAQKEHLGWIGRDGFDELLNVTESGSYTIGAYADPNSTLPKVIKIPRPGADASGEVHHYYLSYRQRVGFDSEVETDLTSGVLLTLGNLTSNIFSVVTTYALDMTPATNYFLPDHTLVPGETFTDAIHGVTITTDAVDGMSATVTVDIAEDSSCVPGDPEVGYFESNPPLGVADTGMFSLVITNTDMRCGSTEFQVGIQGLPANWLVATIPEVVTVPSGGKTLVVVTVTPDASAAVGDYAYTVAVTDAKDATRSISQNKMYQVTDCVRRPPAVAITPSLQSGAPAGSVDYAVAITNMDSGTCGDTYIESLALAPDGWMATGLDASNPPADKLAPGQQKLRTMTVTASPDADAKSFQIPVVVGRWTKERTSAIAVFDTTGSETGGPGNSSGGGCQSHKVADTTGFVVLLFLSGFFVAWRRRRPEPIV